MVAKTTLPVTAILLEENFTTENAESAERPLITELRSFVAPA
jgi:hypothetical protein